MKVRGKVFVLTGAGAGMGREIAIELVKRGARVAAVDMRESALVELKVLLGSEVEIFSLDVTDNEAVSVLPEKVLKSFGRVDGLINNAGIIQPFLKINQLSIEDAARVMAVNFTGPFLLSKAFLPILIAQPEAHIMNVSSMGAYAPVPGQSLYGASKAAIAELTDGLRSELMGTNVGVTTVFPGAINTNIAAHSGISIPESTNASRAIKTTEPTVAAKLMVDAIESGKNRLFIGSDAKVLNLLARIHPKLAAWLIYRNMRELLGE